MRWLRIAAVSVFVTAMSVVDPGLPDESAQQAFQRLAERLRHFGRGASEAVVDYVPERYRAMLFEGQGPAAGARGWPWPDIGVADLVADGGGLGRPRLTMSGGGGDVDVLGINQPLGGLGGITLSAPDGSRTCMFNVRPLFPDEAA